jgi:Family of unknown function (DUF6445)
MTIIPALYRFGEAATPVVSIDGIGAAPEAVRSMAAALAPFPPAHNYYPGVRRIITEQDSAAFGYISELLQAAAPYLGGAFGFHGFALVEGSFSLVTTPPEQLSPAQRAPHFDAIDADLYAVLHYACACAGTAFYRHRASGVELVDAGHVDAFVATSRATAPPAGYVAGDNADYACIGRVEGLAGRVIAYPARLLHSGVIPADFQPSADPHQGRLTTNIFIRGRRNG